MAQYSAFVYPLCPIHRMTLPKRQDRWHRTPPILPYRSLLERMTLDHLKILLVEDDELFRLGLQVRLQQETKIAVLA